MPVGVAMLQAEGRHPTTTSRKRFSSVKKGGDVSIVSTSMVAAVGISHQWQIDQRLD